MINTEKGFTLLEVLASIVILFIILITFFGVFSQTARFTKVTEESLQATSIANLAMELIRNTEPDCVEPQCLLNLVSEAGYVNNEGYFIENPSLKLEIIVASPNDGLIGLVPVKMEIKRIDQEAVLVIRHFYLDEK